MRNGSLILALVVLALTQLRATAGANALPPPNAPVTLDPLTLVAGWINDQPALERIRFVTIALDELARSYESELVTAARDRRKPRDPASLARWRAAARTAIDDARALAATLLPQDEARIYVDPGSSLRFVVHGRTVMVDTPRVGERANLGSRIVARYCGVVQCPELLAPRSAQPRFRAGWSFSARQAAFVETSVGLGFRFDDLDDLRTRKQACETFVAALLASAEQVGWLRDRGALVEWDAFHLALLPDSGASVLVLNHYGDYVELSPRPYEVPRAPLTAWFRARLEGRRYEFVFDRADKIFLARH